MTKKYTKLKSKEFYFNFNARLVDFPKKWDTVEYEKVLQT